MSDKRIYISLKELKEPERPSTTVINFRIEDDLYEAFRSLCKDDLQMGMSEVLRKVIRKLCEESGRID